MWKITFGRTGYKTGCGSFRGLRGGSWNNNENNLRSSNRNNDNPDNENDNNGFRVASPWAGFIGIV
jgi:formylglycine-generating enzyme required for sulfatase activity